MAIQPWIPLSTQSAYAGVDALIVSYMGRKEIGVLAGEESPYRCQAIAAAFQRFVQEDRACLGAGFEQGAVAAFRDAGYSLWRVPVVPVHALAILDVSALRGLSLIRYDDIGFALHIQGYMSIPLFGIPLLSHVPMMNDVVVEIYKRDHRDVGSWTEIGQTGLIAAIDDVYIEIAKPRNNTPATPRLGIKGPENRYQFVARILTGTDPAFRLVGEVPQIEQPLPAKLA